MAKEKKPVAVEWMYEAIQSPHVTEKATLGSDNGQVTFKVAKWATKPQIKEAVETLFSVKVKSVNTLIQKGKSKRFRGIPVRKPDQKKAVITLEDGQMIDTAVSI